MEHNNDSKNILPLCEESPIKSDLRIAVPLMAALSYQEKRKDVWDWILENYTQLFAAPKKITNKIPFDYFHIYSPFFPFVTRHFEKHYRFSWKSPRKTLDYIIKKIEENNYVYVKLDRYYMPGFWGYKNEIHIFHTECIYGFDLSKKELYVIGYTEFSNSTLKKGVISFDDFMKAIYKPINDKYYHTITFDKINKSFTYNIDIDSMINALQYYVNSSVPFKYILDSNIKKQSILSWDFPIWCISGKNAIKHLSKTIKNICINNKKNMRIRTLLQTICEFHQVMLYRLDYLFKKGLIENKYYNQYVEVCNILELCKYMYLKYELIEDPVYIEKICSNIEAANNMSAEVLKSVVMCVQKKPTKSQSIPQKLLFACRVFIIAIKCICREFFLHTRELYRNIKIFR